MVPQANLLQTDPSCPCTQHRPICSFRAPAANCKAPAPAPESGTPDNPIIPFIEGDGIGIDITPVMIKVVDAAVAKAYGGKRKIHWMEVYAGEKVHPDVRPRRLAAGRRSDTLRNTSVSIKGPLTTPVGGGIRSLNVALRQELDLYVCLRPVQYFKGVPSPLKEPEKTNMVIFRENTEDIYAGIEWEAGPTRLQEGHQVPAGRDGRQEDPLPGNLGHRHQAGLEGGHRAPGAQGHPVRDRQRQAAR
jgi:hypothetical protein